MDFKILDIGPNKDLTEDQKNSIAKDIGLTLCFNFPSKPFHRIPNMSEQVWCLLGGTGLFDRYGQYIDKLSSQFNILMGLPANDGKSNNLNGSGNVVDESAVVGGDLAIEVKMAQQLILLKQDKCAIPSREKAASVDISKLNVSDDEQQLFYDMLEDRYYKGKSFYIERAVHGEYFLTSTFAPFAHILLALKSKSKRKDAKNELHSIRYLGSMRHNDIDFSEYFNIIDYWYYEMETGVNLCAEITATLLDLLDRRAIEKTDISILCDAVKECLWMLNPYSLLTRTHLIRTAIQCLVGYMNAVYQHPDSYITYVSYVNLKSPIEGNPGYTFNLPSKKAEQVKFTGEQLANALTEILYALNFNFSNAPIERKDHQYEMVLKHISDYNKISENYPISKDKSHDCALVFCDVKHRNIQELITYAQAKNYGRNSRAEMLFCKVHSTIFKGITRPQEKCSS